MTRLERSELAISRLLRWGVVLSGLIIASGWLSGIARVQEAGLMTLIGLPILRVALTLYLFFRGRDWIFVGLASYVLLLLLSGLYFGKAI